MLSLVIYCYVCWGTRSSPSQMPTALLTTALIIWLHYHLNREDPYFRWPSKSNCHSSACTTHNGALKGVQRGIVHWDKQNHAVPAPNCVLKVRGEIIKIEGL